MKSILNRRLLIQKAAARRAARGRRSRGVTLVETLITVAISAALLTATAAAFVASSQAVTANERVFRASRGARVAVNHLATEVRKATAVALVDQNTLDVITTNDQIRRYQYSPTTGQLLVGDTGSATPTQYVLARDVSSFRFAADSEPDPHTNVLRVTRVTVDMTVSADNIDVHLTGSASPRRARVYNGEIATGEG